MFQLSREEFMNVFFDDLALPNLIKTQLMGIEEMKTVRAGYTNDGTPANINIVRSLRARWRGGWRWPRRRWRRWATPRKNSIP